jgi:hypothetical protein
MAKQEIDLHREGLPLDNETPEAAAKMKMAFNHFELKHVESEHTTGTGIGISRFHINPADLDVVDYNLREIEGMIKYDEHYRNQYKNLLEGYKHVGKRRN